MEQRSILGKKRKGKLGFLAKFGHLFFSFFLFLNAYLVIFSLYEIVKVLQEINYSHKSMMKMYNTMVQEPVGSVTILCSWSILKF